MVVPNYMKIEPFDMVNGEGARVTIWFSGCSHGCKGCFNPISHDPHTGIPFGYGPEMKVYDLVSKPYIDGITITGGDPLHKRNHQRVKQLCREIKRRFPDKNIWLYTGYTFEQIKADPKLNLLLRYIDVLVDGRFDESLKTSECRFRGSSNQRLIRLEGGKIKSIE